MTASPPPAPWTPTLGSLEQRVMCSLWVAEGSSIAELIDRLEPRPAYTTVATVLGNLERKGMVEKLGARRPVTYRAVLSCDEYTARIMARALASSRNRAAVLRHLVEGLGAADTAELRRALSAADRVSPVESSVHASNSPD